MEESRSLWEEMRNHHDAPMFRNKKWMLMGDYNEIMDGEVHSRY